MQLPLLFRFLIGGIVVCAFAAIGDVLKPKSFEQTEKKQRAGLHGAIRGRKVAAVDAVGAAIGSLGMIAFAAIVWQLLPGRSSSLILLDATLAWSVVSVSIWRLRSLFVHWRRLKPMSHHGDIAR